MDWIDILSWLAVAVFLAVLHLSAPKRVVDHPLRVISSAVVGALVGGNILYLLSAAHRDRFGLGALAAAAVLAELGARMAIAVESGARRLTH